MEAMIEAMRVVQTLMAPMAAPVRKDTLEKESHAKVKFRLDLKKSRRTVHQK